MTTESTNAIGAYNAALKRLSEAPGNSSDVHEVGHEDTVLIESVEIAITQSSLCGIHDASIFRCRQLSLCIGSRICTACHVGAVAERCIIPSGVCALKLRTQFS